MNTQTGETMALAPQIAEKNVKKTSKGMPAAVRVILCILLSLILLITAVAGAAITTVKLTVTEENIEKLLDDTDYMTIPLVFDGIGSNLYEIFFVAFANPKTEPTDVYKLAEDTELEKMLAEYIYSYASFILYDEKLDEIDSDVIKEYFDDNVAAIERTFNIEFDRNEIYDVIDKQSEIFDKLSEDGIEDMVPQLGLIRFAMSMPALIILGVLALICIVFIGIISRSAGTPLVISGSITTFIGLAGTVSAVLAIIGTIGFPTVPVTAAGVIWQGAKSALVPNLFNLYMYILTAGVLLILTGGFIGKIRRNIRRAK